MIKTGLFFGSFNPVHIGHLAIAGYMKEFEGMAEIWFIVSPQNPFKSASVLVGPNERLEMVRLAVKDYPSFRASDIEFKMPLPSYTLNTLKKIDLENPERDFYTIIGTDNIESLQHWKGGKTLMSKYKFMVYPRLRSANSSLIPFNNATLANAPVIDVSSSFIRKGISEGRDMRPYVPSAVWDFIIRNKLYFR
jgi:nicotinate-nucleotide adenylyltransferase